MNNEQEKEELIRILEGLTDKFEVVSSKVQMYEFFTDDQHDNRRQILMKTPALFVMLMDSLTTDIIVRLSNLFHANAKRGLKKFLNRLCANAKLIATNRADDIVNIANHHLQQIDGAQSTLDILKTHRDMYRAHSDAKYFDRPELLHADAPLHIDHFKELVRIAQGIIVTCRRILLGTSYSPGLYELYLEMESLLMRLFVYEELAKNDIDHPAFAKAIESIRR